MSTTARDSEGLTPKERKFCEEYVKTYSATQAYYNAYDTKNYDTANSKGYQILRRPGVKAYLDKLEKERCEQMRINAEHILTELANLAFYDTDINKRDKMKAIELLQKQLGLQQQKIQADVNNEININIGE